MQRSKVNSSVSSRVVGWLLFPCPKLCTCCRAFNTFQVIVNVSFGHGRCDQRLKNIRYNMESIELTCMQLGLGDQLLLWVKSNLSSSYYCCWKSLLLSPCLHKIKQISHALHHQNRQAKGMGWWRSAQWPWIVVRCELKILLFFIKNKNGTVSVLCRIIKKFWVIIIRECIDSVETSHFLSLRCL